LNEIGAVMSEKDQIIKTMLTGKFDLVFEQWFASHGNHGFWQIAQPRPKTGASAAR
jgi:hypothetical protein